ncbi:E3 SUMO-protein ligase MMS21 isoform X2 [Ananas comosus]|uniref:E3 SUMO-protein ligase MMS21 isoform X2 n=1 Tax=Ananas comosus TaxID=4615 RepID=A0A6P5GGZ3_ANACO|nr:E3 SUMO-protein ligase MMS21 isoform X2 [Ananas comosus]
MAASTSRPSAAASRIATAAANVSSENQSLIAEIRKALGIIKSVAVDLEREEKSENVKQLEDAVLKLLDTYDGCVRFSEAVQIVSGDYQPSDQNVHHAGQPMPGEEQEEVVMTSTQCNLLNITCPLTGKPVIELTNPVRCVDCKHIYEKDPIMHYIRTMKPQPRCPVAGCPKILQVGRVVCDALLPIEIEEMRSTETAAVHSTIVEDFTEVDDE